MPTLTPLESGSAPEACPYCGWENPDLWEYREGDTETECDNCGRQVLIRVTTSVAYAVIRRKERN